MFACWQLSYLKMCRSNNYAYSSRQDIYTGHMAYSSITCIKEELLITAEIALIYLLVYNTYIPFCLE